MECGLVGMVGLHIQRHVTQERGLDIVHVKFSIQTFQERIPATDQILKTEIALSKRALV